MTYDYYILRPSFDPASDGVWVVELWAENPIHEQGERLDIALFDGKGAKDLAERFAASFDIPSR